jgi:hypothetical protein
MKLVKQSNSQPARRATPTALKVKWVGAARFKVPIPRREKQRVAALDRYHILDTPPEEIFDDITTLAALICQTPIALITLIDPHRQWFKSKVGITMNETRRDISFCAHAILKRTLFIVEDAAADKRFAWNPLVTADPKIRFYAGAPLITADNHALGTLCVLDHVPRTLRAEQKHAMQALGRQVMALLELRRLKKLQRTRP